MNDRSEPIMTAIGSVGSALRAAVDARGVVTPNAAGWSLDWWVMADDGWHFASSERGSKMSQRLVDAMPVVETAMRVPGGQVCHRAYVIAGADEYVVVELTNRTPVPVAVAFEMRPPGGELRDGNTVVVDQRVALVLPRAPSQRKDASFVYPLPHTATIRALVPLGAAQDSPTLPATVVSSEQVVNGWLAHAQRGMRVELPDRRLQEAVDAARMALLLRAHDDPTRLAVLDRYGMDDVPVDVSASVIARNATRIVRARRKRQRHRTEPNFGDDLLDWTELRAAEELLRIGGEPRAAAQVAIEVERFWSERLRSSLEMVSLLLDAASTTWTWPDERTADALLFLVRDLLVREATADGSAALDVLTLVPDDWLGQGVDVHDAPTQYGLLSYAVRWHGDRPALLWDLRPRDRTVVLRAPGLDPAWSTTEPVGEVLLAPVGRGVTIT